MPNHLTPRLAGASAYSLPVRAPTGLRAGVAAALLATLMGCSTTSPDVIQRGDANRMATVLDATVLSTRPVVVDGQQSGLGGSAGGVVGGIAGSTVGSGRESTAVAVLGAVAGAVVGNAIERMATRETAVEVLVQLRSGERRAIVQAKGEENLQPGDAVIIVTTGGKVRVTKAPGGTAAAPAPASARQ
jgi:outer membrane lipoprotein SlyB